jgi:hypothetical protein
MTYTISHVSGAMEIVSSIDALPPLVAELDNANAEHPDISLMIDDGWVMSAYPNGSVVLEHLQSGDRRHLVSVERPRVTELMARLAQGGPGALDAEPWLPGYP